MTERRALVVRGGWEGHSPVEATDLFIPYLKENGYDVTVSDTTESYLDLDGVDLVLQCVTMSEIPAEHVKALDAAIRTGTGLAGWHGGIADSFRNSADYNFIVGGQFISHPHGFTDYRVDVVPEHSGHPIVEGITHFDVHTEQYYVHYDPTDTVLATTTFKSHPDYPWIEGAVMPAIWTRTWGEGKVFVCTVGHKLDDLENPEVRTVIERGLLWASK